MSRNFIVSSCFPVCVSKTCPKGEYGNLACSIISLSLESNIAFPKRYSYLSIFLVDNADIFAASQLISYGSFPSLILSSIAMIIFYFLSKRFFLKHEELSDARVALITENEYGFTVHFLHRFIKS